MTGEGITQTVLGHGGWVRVDDDDLPAVLYVRLAVDDRGRWYPTELYLDGRGGEITAGDLRALPLSGIVALAAAGDDDALRKSARRPGPDLSRLASHFRTGFGSRARHWVADSMRAQLGAVPQAPMGREPQVDRKAFGRPWVPRYTGELSDAFLRDVGAFYGWCVTHRLRPSRELEAAIGVSHRTAQDWFRVARARGIMPPARPGKAG